MLDLPAVLLFSSSTTPTPSPTVEQVDPNLVTPGPLGFAIIAFIALAVIFLVWDMMRRIRRGRVRADIDEMLEAEAEAEAERAVTATETDDEVVDRDDTGGDTPPTR